MTGKEYLINKAFFFKYAIEITTRFTTAMFTTRVIVRLAIT